MRALLILLLAIGWLHTGSAQDTTNIVSDEDLKLLQANEDYALLRSSSFTKQN